VEDAPYAADIAQFPAVKERWTSLNAWAQDISIGIETRVLDPIDSCLPRHCMRGGTSVGSSERDEAEDDGRKRNVTLILRVLNTSVLASDKGKPWAEVGRKHQKPATPRAGTAGHLRGRHPHRAGGVGTTGNRSERPFGAKPNVSYLIGSVVNVTFQAANPRISLRLERTFAALSQLGADGR